MDKFSEIIQAFSKCANDRVNWETLYSEAYQYTIPQRDTFNYKTDGGENDNKELFDSTPLDCINKFSSNIQSSLMPPGQKWVSLKPGYKVPDDQKKDMQEQLDIINNILFSNLHNSDFDMEISSSLPELCFGTGCLFIQRGDKKNPLYVKSIPLPELYIEKVGNGKYSNVFRKHSIKYNNIKDVWADAKIPDNVEKDKQASLIEYIRKNENLYDYFVADETSKNVIVERKMRYNPFIIFRWSVVSGEVYGRGPVLQAMPDIKSLNITKELILKNASLAITGVYLVDEDNAPNIKNIKLKPGALIPITRTSIGDPITPLQNPANFNIGDIIIKDLRQSIRDMLFADALGPVDLPVKSATEISYRQQNLAKQIGSAYGRLQNEMVKPIINNCLIILDELNIINMNGIKLDDGVYDIEIKSPLAMAQQDDDVNKIIRFVQTIAEIVGPQIAMAVIKPNIIERLSVLMGIDQSIIKNTDEIEQVIKSITQMAQEQQPPQVNNV